MLFFSHNVIIFSYGILFLFLQLLKLLLENKGIVLTREKILGKIWGDSYYGNPNVLEVYIRYLRNKLESKGKDSIIKTIRGVGYSLK